MKLQPILTLTFDSYAVLDNAQIASFFERTLRFAVAHTADASLDEGRLRFHLARRHSELHPFSFPNLRQLSGKSEPLTKVYVGIPPGEKWRQTHDPYIDEVIYAHFWRHKESDWPVHFDLSIRGDLFDDQVPFKLQSELVALACDLYTGLAATTGYITFDTQIYSIGGLSPYERIAGLRMPQVMPGLRSNIRGYYWGTFLAPSHVALLGGQDALEAAPVHAVTWLRSGAAFLQLTPDVNRIERQALLRVRDFLSPVIPSPDPQGAVMENIFGHLITELPAGRHDLKNRAETRSREATGRLLAQLEKTLTIHRQAEAGLPTTQDEPEARSWIKSNPIQHAPVAAERFETRENLLAFVDAIYERGARFVGVALILDEPQRIEKDGGPYALGLTVNLPEDAGQIAAILELVNEDCVAWAKTKEIPFKLITEAQGSLLLTWP